MTQEMKEPTAKARGTHWRAVASMFALNGALFGVWASRIPAVKDLHNLSHSALGGLLLLMAAGAIVAFPIAGWLSDKRGAAQVTRIIGVLNALALFGLAMAPGPFTLGLILLAFGAFHGGMDVAMNGWAAEVERWSKRAQMSTYHAMWSLGAGIGAGTGYLAITFGFGLFWHFLLAGGGLLFVALLFSQDGWVSKINTEARNAVFSLPKGALVLVGLLAMCASMGEGAMADWSAIYLRDEVGVRPEWAPIGFAIFSIAMVATRLSGGWINRLAPPHKVARVAGLVGSSGMVLAILSPAVPGTLAGFVLFGMGLALMFPLAFSRAANDPDIPQGQALAGVATLGYGGILLGPPIMGFIASATSLTVSFAVLAGMALMITVLSGALKVPE
ncbi:sugar phosphate permease [Shimia isoporae]|uniref:Sugar phosphate permease n=1 Tax=Shimia isoporae TaxID=647720 RepID=A0A4R1NMX6_9RHOB|nr:MFS transporter [Shimia isoporae]TCL09777.1 sugar phosphate permease [Shimia isoporae]